MASPTCRLAATLLLAAAPAAGRALEPLALPGEGAAVAPAPGPALVFHLHPSADTLTIGAAALAVTLPSLFSEELIKTRCPCDPATVNGFDRSAISNHNAAADVVSSVTVVAAMVAPPLLDLADLGTGDAFYGDLTVFADVLLVNAALVEGAKYVFQRPLPRTYAGDPKLVSSSGGYRSFYSGHTSTAFAALTATAYTMRLRRGEQVWPWIVAAGVGASVGVERVAAGRHFPSDVIVGAVAGTLVGIGVPWLHTRGRLAIVPAGRGLALAAEL